LLAIGTAIPLHFGCPGEKPPQASAFPPEKLPKTEKTDLLHLHPAVSFNAPQQVGTPPWRQPMMPGRIPYKAERGEHTATSSHSQQEFVVKSRSGNWRFKRETKVPAFLVHAAFYQF
jgi:hypothetical protein